MLKRILVEIYMAAAFVLLYNRGFTGERRHEMLGLTVFILVLFHLALNYRWFRRMGRSSRTVTNLFTIVTFFGTILTGIASSELFESVNRLDSALISDFRELHACFAYAALCAVALHAFQHGKSIYQRFLYILKT